MRVLPHDDSIGPVPVTVEVPGVAAASPSTTATSAPVAGHHRTLVPKPHALAFTGADPVLPLVAVAAVAAALALRLRRRPS